jgi:G3E family GTPase
MIREHNTAAAIVTTPWDMLDAQLILDTIEQNNVLMSEEEIERAHEHHHHHHHHDHDEHCDCGCHDHEHEHHEHHHHDHDEHCDCGCHDHEHHHHEHGEGCSCGCHDADEAFESYGMETIKRFSKDELEEILEELDNNKYGMVLRAKGIVPAVDGSWIHFDYVPGEADIRTGSADYTGRLCVIGANLNKTEIRKLLGV